MEDHVVGAVEAAHVEQPQIGLGHAGERVVVARHDLGSDHQVELVDQAMRQEVGPERAAAEDEGIAVGCSRSPATAVMSVGPADDRGLVAVGPGVLPR